MRALLLTAAAATGAAAQPPPDRAADVVVEIAEVRGKTAFSQRGLDKAGTATVVVGQTLRWVNRTTQPQRLVSDAAFEGRPVVDTGLIEPGKSRDVVVDNVTYRRAKGTTAGSVTLTLRAPGGKADPAGELTLVSPARK